MNLNIMRIYRYSIVLVDSIRGSVRGFNICRKNKMADFIELRTKYTRNLSLDIIEFFNAKYNSFT